METPTINVLYEDLLEIKRLVKDADAPMVEFTGDLKTMKEAADEITKSKLWLTLSIIKKYIKE